MSNVFLKSTKQYLRSVNTPDYLSNSDAMINPDISAVEGFPTKYWKENGGVLELMTSTEQSAVDIQEMDDQNETLASNLDRALKALVIALNDGSFIPGSNYDNQTIKSIIKGKL